MGLNIFVSLALHAFRATGSSIAIDLHMFFDEASVDLICNEHIVRKYFKVSRYRCFNWAYREFIQSAFHCGDGFLAGGLMND